MKKNKISKQKIVLRNGQYKISEKIFLFNSDINSKDAVFFNNFLTKLDAKNNKIIYGDFVSEDIEEFFKIVLRTKEGIRFSHKDFINMDKGQRLDTLINLFVQIAILGFIKLSETNN